MQYYTMQITLQFEIAGHLVHEFKDIEGSYENIRICQEVWIRGVKVETAPGSYELISPYVIKKVLLLRQDKKYAL